MSHLKLFNIRGWEIRPFTDEDLPNLTVMAHHAVCKHLSEGDVSWFQTEIPAKCWYCKKAVPDEIQALCILYDGFS